MGKELNNKHLDKEQISDLESKAILKYERDAKPYRAMYTPIPRQIKCQKCGAVYNLIKHKDENGNEYWFCKDCIIQRARELKAKESR